MARFGLPKKLHGEVVKRAYRTSLSKFLRVRGIIPDPLEQNHGSRKCLMQKNLYHVRDEVESRKTGSLSADQSCGQMRPLPQNFKGTLLIYHADDNGLLDRF